MQVRLKALPEVTRRDDDHERRHGALASAGGRNASRVLEHGVDAA
jgi:hypothetical protein